MGGRIDKLDQNKKDTLFYKAKYLLFIKIFLIIIFF